MIQTSNYATAAGHPNAVAISQGVPVWYRGTRYAPLAPPWSLVRERDQTEYRRRYLVQLDRLDPQRVLEDIGPNAILLCWEKAGDFCHRRLVAEWLERHTGVTVPELARAVHLEDEAARHPERAVGLREAARRIRIRLDGLDPDEVRDATEGRR